jgi:hypothetical protein
MWACEVVLQTPCRTQFRCGHLDDIAVCDSHETVLLAQLAGVAETRLKLGVLQFAIRILPDNAGTSGQKHPALSLLVMYLERQPGASVDV